MDIVDEYFWALYTLVAFSYIALAVYLRGIGLVYNPGKFPDHKKVSDDQILLGIMGYVFSTGTVFVMVGIYSMIVWFS